VSTVEGAADGFEGVLSGLSALSSAESLLASSETLRSSASGEVASSSEGGAHSGLSSLDFGLSSAFVSSAGSAAGCLVPTSPEAAASPSSVLGFVSLFPSGSASAFDISANDENAWDERLENGED
jgi:hypothetical protein